MKKTAFTLISILIVATTVYADENIERTEKKRPKKSASSKIDPNPSNSRELKKGYTKVFESENDGDLFVKESSIKQVGEGIYTIDTIRETWYRNFLTRYIGAYKINCNTVHREEGYFSRKITEHVGSYSNEDVIKYINGHEMGKYGAGDYTIVKGYYPYKLKEIVCDNSGVTEIK